MTKRLNRRDAIKGLGMTAGAAALPGSLASTTARAQAGGRVVVGTWGGDYAKLLNKNVEEPFLKPKGFEVVQDIGDDKVRRTKTMAEQRLPRGTVDIQGFSAAQMFEMNEAGALQQIDYARLTNAGNIMPAMKYPYGVGHIYSGKVVVYNPKLINPAPTTYKDVFDPKYGNKLGFIDIQYQYVMLAAGTGGAGDDEGAREGQGAAARRQEGRRAHLSHQRGLRAGPQDRGDRHRPDVEGARRAVAERRHQRRKHRAVGRHHGLCLGLRDPEERAQQGRRLRLHGRDAGEAARRRTSRSTWATTRP